MVRCNRQYGERAVSESGPGGLANAAALTTNSGCTAQNLLAHYHTLPTYLVDMFQGH